MEDLDADVVPLVRPLRRLARDHLMVAVDAVDAEVGIEPAERLDL
ncbi:hypothetical protein [Intrasporangium calvum]|nr:hypothetical protein [Intrasporangium calvum]